MTDDPMFKWRKSKKGDASIFKDYDPKFVADAFRAKKLAIPPQIQQMIGVQGIQGQFNPGSHTVTPNAAPQAPNTASAGPNTTGVGVLDADNPPGLASGTVSDIDPAALESGTVSAPVSQPSEGEGWVSRFVNSLSLRPSGREIGQPGRTLGDNLSIFPPNATQDRLNAENAPRTQVAEPAPAPQTYLDRATEAFVKNGGWNPATDNYEERQMFFSEILSDNPTIRANALMKLPAADRLKSIIALKNIGYKKCQTKQIPVTFLLMLVQPQKLNRI
jgi:hypothetical protein